MVQKYFQRLQQDVEKKCSWAERNCMTLSSGKFDFMRPTQRTDQVEFEYKTMDGFFMKRTTGAKDLSVLMSKDCRFLEQFMKSSLSGKKKTG